MGTLLHRIGHLAARRPGRTALVWLVIAAATIAANGAWGGEPTNSFDIPGAESQRAVDLIEDRFPGLTGTTSRIVFHTETGRLDDPAIAASIDASVRDARALEDVGGVTDPFDPDAATVSADGRTAYATIDYSVRFDELTPEHLDAIRSSTSPAAAAGVQVEIGGAVADFADEDTEGNESFGLAVALIVLLIALGSVAAALLPIGLALFALVIGTGFLGLLAAAGDVPEDTTSLATMIGLGVGIDYALFVLTRYRQLVSDGQARVDAIAHANATAGQAVVFAGTTVLIAIVGTPRIRAAGHRDDGVRHRHRGRAVGARRGDPAASAPWRGGTPHRRPDRPHPPPTTQGVQPTGRLDLRRTMGPPRRKPPGPVRPRQPHLLVTLAVPLARPSHRVLRRRRRVHRADNAAGVRPPHRCLRTGVQRNAPRGHRPHGDRGPDEGGHAICRPPWLPHDGIGSVSPPLLSAEGDAAIVTAIPEWGPQDEATATLVDDLRGDVLPQVEDRTGATVLLGGSVAGFADVSDQLSEPVALVHRCGRRDLGVAADGRVPLGPRPAEGSRDEPAVHRSRLRRRRRRLPVGLGLVARRCRSDRADQPVRADDDVRHPLRAVDGLRGLPPQPHPRRSTSAPATTITRSSLGSAQPLA